MPVSLISRVYLESCFVLPHSFGTFSRVMVWGLISILKLVEPVFRFPSGPDVPWIVTVHFPMPSETQSNDLPVLIEAIIAVSSSHVTSGSAKSTV